MLRRVLSVEDRAQIAAGLTAGCSIRAIAERIGRCPSVVCREIARNRGPEGYAVPAAEAAAQQRRRRPKTRRLDAEPLLRDRVLADLKRSRSPRQIAGRLRAEARDASLEPCKGSPPAQGATVAAGPVKLFV